MKEGRFYLLEMNARIQVEHPVTEWIHGLDLVGLQLDPIALGKGLPKGLERETTPTATRSRSGSTPRIRRTTFLPQSGRIAALRLPSGPGVRVDPRAVREGDVVGMDFDPMIAKLSVWGADRAQAVARLRTALAETRSTASRRPSRSSCRSWTIRDVVANDISTQFLERRTRAEAAVPRTSRERRRARPPSSRRWTGPVERPTPGLGGRAGPGAVANGPDVTFGVRG